MNDPINEQAACVERVREAERIPPNYRLAEKIHDRIRKWDEDRVRWHPTDIYQIIENWNESIRLESSEADPPVFAQIINALDRWLLERSRKSYMVRDEGEAEVIQLMKQLPPDWNTHALPPEQVNADTARQSHICPNCQKAIPLNCSHVGWFAGVKNYYCEAALPPEPEPQAVAPGESWRMLKIGEVIQEGDEFESLISKQWRPVASTIGQAIQSDTPSPFRRRV